MLKKLGFFDVFDVGFGLELRFVMYELRILIKF